MRHRCGQVDMTHTLTTYFGLNHFNRAFFTHNATVLQALVFTAQALVILDRAKDLGAEQAIALRFERTVVDGLRLFNFAIGP